MCRRQLRSRQVGLTPVATCAGNCLALGRYAANLSLAHFRILPTATPTRHTSSLNILEFMHIQSEDLAEFLLSFDVLISIVRIESMSSIALNI
jgi:hypothetical protein